MDPKIKRTNTIFVNKNIFLFFIHLPLLFILILFPLSLLFNKKYSIYLSKGESIFLNPILKSNSKTSKIKKFLLKRPSKIDLKLIDFIKIDEQIISMFSLNSLKKNNKIKIIDFKIKYNKPFYYKNFTFYQEGLKFYFINFKFSFKNKVYNLKTNKDIQLFINNYEFKFFPLKLQSKDEILFKWILINNNNKIIKQGYFTNLNYKKDNFLKKTGFTIKDIKFIVFNKIKVNYNPFKKWLFYFSTFFLLILVINFYFYIKRQNNQITEKTSNN